ncbi:ParA family protein [Novosphingobium lentum]|uniref:ParA family protein n=1 Tax=Novosphingobium lentum TaxID=145287 RepID=UPI00082B2677|nr:ParA family protein [Novosphingobium lentum]
MAVVAVYSVKGGVGKSTIAASLAWSAATLSRRQTLLWDLDVQGAAAFLTGCDAANGSRAASIFTRDLEPDQLIVPTPYDRLDLLPSDDSLRRLESLFAMIGKRRRLARLTEILSQRYERIVLDCPPALNELSAQIIRAATLIVVPLPPSPLARRALEAIRGELAYHHKKHPPLLPVLSMVDMRRKLHRDTVAELPDWPIIPMASQIEQMAARRAPIGSFAGASEPGRALARLWTGVERKLVEG